MRDVALGALGEDEGTVLDACPEREAPVGFRCDRCPVVGRDALGDVAAVREERDVPNQRLVDADCGLVELADAAVAVAGDVLDRRYRVAARDLEGRRAVVVVRLLGRVVEPAQAKPSRDAIAAGAIVPPERV